MQNGDVNIASNAINTTFSIVTDVFLDKVLIISYCIYLLHWLIIKWYNFVMCNEYIRGLVADGRGGGVPTEHWHNNINHRDYNSMHKQTTHNSEVVNDCKHNGGKYLFLNYEFDYFCWWI